MAVDDKYTLSLLHFEDGLKDESGKIWAATGSAAVTSDNAKWGKCLHTPGGSYIACKHDDFAFGNEDFSIDFWMLYSSGWSGISSAEIGSSIGISIQHDLVWVGNNSAFIKGLPGNGQFAAGKMAHYALCRKNGKGYYFVNGKLVSTGDLSAAINTTTILINGRYANGYPGDDCYFEEVRISRGIALWTSDFDPPSAPYNSIQAPSNVKGVAGDSKVEISWTAVSGAMGYNVKRSLNPGGPYTIVGLNVVTPYYTDASVSNSVTYYYVVTAINATSESGNSEELAVTPVEAGNGVLLVRMDGGTVKEYELIMAELNAFIKWYTDKFNGIGAGYYVFDKKGNSDFFQNRKEYVVFDKIQSIEIIKLR